MTKKNVSNEVQNSLNNSISSDNIDQVVTDLEATAYEKHDSTYHNCFSIQEIAKDLFKGCLPKRLIKSLDFSRMHLLPDTFVTRAMDKRYSDLIWKIYWQNRPYYICILCEFQSYNYRFMVLRIAEYTLLIWRKLVESGEVSSELPLILPIVIYNGPQKWTAPLNIKSLLRNEYPALLKYQVQQTFLLVDMSHDPRLARLDNNFTGFFAGLEQILANTNLKCLFKIVDKRLQDLLGTGNTAESNERYYIVFEAVKNFLSYIISKHSKKNIIITGDDLMSLESNFNKEWKPMCDRQFEQGFAKGEEQGIEIGKGQGIEIGRDQGIEIGIGQGITRENLRIATNMLYENFSFEMINKITGLELSSIQELAKNIKK